jgi:O-antigen/teichoic acid export membrane protein
MLKAIVRQHLVGLIGQVSAALPLLLVTVFLSRWVGVKEAGYFSIYIGSSAIVYSIALWGLRSQIVLDRFRHFDSSSYLAYRCVAVFLSGLMIFMIADHGNVNLALVWIVILFRAVDSFIDLSMAFDQVNMHNSSAIRNFCVRHLSKLAVVAVSFIFGYIFDHEVMYLVLVLAGVTLLVFCLSKHVHIETQKKSVQSSLCIGRMSAIFKAASWFAIASVACAVITNIPRVAVVSFYDGEMVGIVGVTLSVTAFFGMVFNMTWVRALPKFSSEASSRGVARFFVLENAAISVILFLACYFLLPFIVAMIFGFQGVQNLELSRNVMLCSVIFFLGQIFSNLFKITSKPWLESCSYVVGLLVGVSYWVIFGTDNGYYPLLISSGLAMGIFSLVLFFGLNRNQEQNLFPLN